MHTSSNTPLLDVCMESDVWVAIEASVQTRMVDLQTPAG